MKRGLSILLAVIISVFSPSLKTLVMEKRLSLTEAFPFSVENERELGEEVFTKIQRRMEIVQVSAVQEYLDGVGRKLIRNSDHGTFPIQFFTLRASDPNAFAIPGGRIFVTTGLIGLVEREGELAGVMSHEIAHVVRRHIAQRIEASKRLNIATLAGALAGILVGGSGGGAIMAGSMAITESEKLKYTRENESEADRLGLAYMTKAGYDGHDMISFLKKIYKATHYDVSFPPYLATHPGIPTRISYLETLMGGAQPPSTPAGWPSEELNHIQMRVLLIEQGPLEALNHFNGRLENHPDDGDAFFGRALAKKEMGRVKESIEDLKRAHTLKPADPEILKELGLGFIRTGRFTEGVRALERSLALSGENAEALHYLGQGYQAQKKFDPAIESYLKARRLSPDLPELDRNLGSAYKEKGDAGRAHFYYGLYFKKKGETKYARFHLEKALQFSDQDPERKEEAMRALEQLKP